MQLLHCAWLYISHIDLFLWSALIHRLPSVAALTLYVRAFISGFGFISVCIPTSPRLVEF